MRFRLREGVLIGFCCPLLAFFMPGGDYGFAIDCSSHVRVRPLFHIKTIFENQMLTNPARIAICNRNKVVVTLTIIVWGTSIGFHLHSKFLPLAPVEGLESRMNVIGDRYRAGELPISIILDPFYLSHPGPLCMGPYATNLWVCPERFQRS